MKQLNFKSLRSGATTPFVRFAHSGMISISAALLSMLGVKQGDSITITEEEDDVFIAKAKNGGGYEVRFFEGSSNGHVQCRALVEYLKTKYDLALGDDKQPSILFEIDKQTVTHDGVKYHRLITE